MALLGADPDGSFDQGTTGKGAVKNAKKLLKLIFGSYGILLVALNFLVVAVIFGDLFADFTGGFITDFGDFMIIATGSFGGGAMGNLVTYLSGLLIAGIIFTGPMHYYAQWNHVDIILALLITYLFIGIVLGRMFKHPVWAFLSGFAVMGSFVMTLSLLIGGLDQLASGFSGIIYAVLEGLFDADSQSVMLYAVLENGAILGLVSMLWASIFSPGKKKGLVEIDSNCFDGDICKV